MNSAFPILNAAISINACQFSSELIPLRTDFTFLEQFYIEEKVGVFLSSRERHIKFPIRASKTNKWKQTPSMKDTQKAKFNSSHKTIGWGKDQKTIFVMLMKMKRLHC